MHRRAKKLVLPNVSFKKRKRNFRPIFVTFFPIKLACIVPKKNKSHRDNVTLLEILSNWVEHD